MSNKNTYEGYAIGSTVFAIAEHRDKDLKKGEPSPYVAIFTAIVRDVWFSINEKTNQPTVEYGLKTPHGEDWGSTVESYHVSDDINDLVEFMKPIWEGKSNEH